jgi:hypothetical protein
MTGKDILQHSQGYKWQTYNQHCTRWWKTESISSESRNEIRVSNLFTLIQYSAWNKGKERVQGIQIGKKKSNYLIYGWYNPKLMRH